MPAENISLSVLAIISLISFFVFLFICSWVCLSLGLRCPQGPEDRGSPAAPLTEPYVRCKSCFSVSIFFTNILPLLTILYYRKVGKLSAFDAPLREQRIELRVIAAMYNAVGFIFLAFTYFPASWEQRNFCFVL